MLVYAGGSALPVYKCHDERKIRSGLFTIIDSGLVMLSKPAFWSSSTPRKAIITFTTCVCMK